MHQLRTLGLASILWPLCVHAEKLPVKVYTTADGLAHNHINRIKTDSHGFLWFCTDGGLSRFDGRRFFTLTTQDGLPHPDVTDIVEARDGAFWLSTDGGVSKFVLAAPGTVEKPKIHTIRSAEHPQEHFDAIEFDRLGRLWVGGKSGLYQVEITSAGDRLRWMGAPIPGASIPRLLADRASGLWIATVRGAVYRSDDGQYARVPLSPFGSVPFVEALHQDRAGKIWLGYRAGGGLCRLSVGVTPGPLSLDFCLGAAQGIPPEIRSILDGEDGALWLGTATGLFEFEPETKRIAKYTTEHGLTEDHVLKMADDPEGNLWLGTAQSGLMRLPRPGFVQFTEADGFVPGWDPSFYQMRDGRVIASEGGVPGHAKFFAVEGRRLLEFWNTGHDPRSSQERYGSHPALEDAEGRLWLGGGPILYRFPPRIALGQLRSVRPERGRYAADMWHRRLYQDREGAIWSAMAGRSGILTTGRVLLRDSANGAFHTIPSIEASLARVRTINEGGAEVECLQEDAAGGMWLGVRQDWIVPPASATLLRYSQGQVREFSPADGLPRGSVTGMYLDRRGGLWLATHAGLARTSDPAANQPSFTIYTIRQGLSSDEVYCVTEDDNGFLYIGTANGVDRLDPKTGAIRHFNTNDGLPHGRVAAAVRDRGGSLWFASDTAISRFEPRQLRPLREPAIFVSFPSREVTLRYDNNTYEAEFSSPSFGGPPVRFQYRVTGVDDNWRAPVAEGFVRYAGMSPGSYELQARAVNAEGGVSAQPATVRFTVTPPFWRTWWFALLAASLAAWFIYQVHHYRVRQLLAVERLRNRIAADLHDDIGSTLSQVSMLSELAKRSLNGGHPAATDLIERMATASRDAVSSMGDIVWSIHPRHDSLNGVAQRMRRFASDVLSARGMEFYFTAPEQELELGLEARRDLLLIFKESIHNAARHSHGRRVCAVLEVNGRDLRLTVEDDGEGIYVNGEPGGHGLLTMRTRAEKLGGTCEIGATPAGGTRVLVTIPSGRALV